MQVHEERAQGDVSPVQILLDLAGAYTLPRCLHVVADLGVADALNETPRTAPDLARAVNADSDALGRVLRLLAAHRIFAVDGEAFTHTPASQLLRTDHPHSMRAFVRMFGLHAFWDTLSRPGLRGQGLRQHPPAAARSRSRCPPTRARRASAP